jgi:aspartyl-tRNA(Asn)/glutamyl-tRNA(Gln) amidotransferase subunit C
MSIDSATVSKIAKLARIALSEDEKNHYATEIGGIMQWIEQLQQVNTDGVEPLMSVSNSSLPLREDVVASLGTPEAVLKNAPKQEFGCFVVPKVIE